MKARHTPIEQLACAAGTLRRASRSVTRLYDTHLARAGLTTMQFSVLRTIQRSGGRTALADLADDLVFERTSLYRALTPLRRDGLVAVRSGADGRSREIVLTARATRRIASAMPHWMEAQREVLDCFGAQDWPALASTLGRLTAIARAAHARGPS